MTRLEWEPILHRAEVIVRTAEFPMTVRDCWYSLYGEGWFTPPGAVRTDPKAESTRLKGTYNRLSHLTAQRREDGTFPDFVDTTRTIEEQFFFDGPDSARDYLTEIYQHDRTEGQEWNIFLGIEKRGHIERLKRWFHEPFGLPILPFGGYSSRTLIDDTIRKITEDGRPSVLLYAGDLDASGEGIEDNFVSKVGIFDKVERLALTLPQLYEKDYLIFYGKEGDKRAKRFAAKYRAMLPTRNLSSDVRQLLMRI